MSSSTSSVFRATKVSQIFTKKKSARIESNDTLTQCLCSSNCSDNHSIAGTRTPATGANTSGAESKLKKVKRVIKRALRQTARGIRFTVKKLVYGVSVVVSSIVFSLFILGAACWFFAKFFWVIFCYVWGEGSR